VQLVDQRIYNTQRHPVNKCQHLGSQGEPIPRWANLEFYLGLVWLVWLRFFLWHFWFVGIPFLFVCAKNGGRYPKIAVLIGKLTTTTGFQLESHPTCPEMPWGWHADDELLFKGKALAEDTHFLPPTNHCNIPEYKHENVIFQCGGSMAQSEINYVLVAEMADAL
jgi:hypothetical protein